jgi:hypothetical protein
MKLTLKNEARSLVLEYAKIFSDLERLEELAANLQSEKDELMARLTELRDRERLLIDNIGAADSNVTLEQILS